MANSVSFEPGKQTLYYVGWRSFHHTGYLVAYDRERDLVGVTKYDTCSCNNTEELFQTDTWDTVNWEYQGTADAFYHICQQRQDFKLPQRTVSEDDFNAKWILKLQAAFCEWYEADKPHWEDESPKRQFNAFRGGRNDRITEMEGGSSYNGDMADFDTDVAIRDADTAQAKEWIESLGGEGSRVKLVLPDGEDLDVTLSAGREN